MLTNETTSGKGVNKWFLKRIICVAFMHASPPKAHPPLSSKSNDEYDRQCRTDGIVKDNYLSGPADDFTRLRLPLINF
ncbi:hypothetical protein CEXT_185561 [Caerostris extrusa]|uniref:Uncharacterized protein n=1 Tax=Caerostris extrusa TaxID=172846 RepID=A0AAV4SGJ1_CAEEX|nr:hypothetical protein CEXT_185561 [Caerostris extrusa]